MDERTLLAVMSGERRDALAAAVRALLRAASWIYRIVVAVRNVAYDCGGLHVHTASVPVISVGNLTTGGTGKTPVVAWLVHELRARGYHPGILSRGYRSLNGHVNDEALVLEHLCPGTPHIQQRDRVAGAQLAVEQHGCDVLLLDDGFQHRRLHRDLEIVLIDAVRPWGYGHLLPRGLLREPVESLWRADVVMVTRADQPADPPAVPSIAQALRSTRGTDAHVAARFTAERWLTVTGKSQPLSLTQRDRIGAFCGIGNPQAFVRSVAQHTDVVAERLFADHHHYTEADLDQLDQWRQSLGVRWLATTLKDLVKIPAEHPIAAHLLALETCTELSGTSRLMSAIDAVCPRRASRQAA